MYKELLEKEEQKFGSRRSAAYKMGIPPASLGNYLDYDIIPRMPTLLKLSNYFKMSVPELLDEKQDVVTTTAASGGAVESKIDQGGERELHRAYKHIDLLEEKVAMLEKERDHYKALAEEKPLDRKSGLS